MLVDLMFLTHLSEFLLQKEAVCFCSEDFTEEVFPLKKATKANQVKEMTYLFLT